MKAPNTSPSTISPQALNVVGKPNLSTEAKTKLSEKITETAKQSADQIAQSLSNPASTIDALGVQAYTAVQEALKAVTESPDTLMAKLTEGFQVLSKQSEIISQVMDKITASINGDKGAQSLGDIARDIRKHQIEKANKEGEIPAEARQAGFAARSLAAAQMAHKKMITNNTA